MDIEHNCASASVAAPALRRQPKQNHVRKGADRAGGAAPKVQALADQVLFLNR